uniref:Uncharacterized protein n=1 Tax=Populus trichocarpa TaxID=3694 RepID=A0A2K2BM15_POPTR
MSKRTLPTVRLSLNFLVMQYFFNTKNQIHFDPIIVLNHFMLLGVAEPFTMGGANAQGRSLDKRIHSRIAIIVESLTSEKKCLAEARKRLTHFICQANDLYFVRTIVNPNRKDWIVYETPCHLFVEFEHKAYSTIKAFNSNLDDASQILLFNPYIQRV